MSSIRISELPIVTDINQIDVIVINENNLITKGIELRHFIGGLTSEDLDFSGNITISGDATITGDLVLDGVVTHNNTVIFNDPVIFNDVISLPGINGISLNDLDDVDVSTPVTGQVLVYNGVTQEWEGGDTGSLNAVVDDPTPQLGGDLDVNGKKIVSVAGNNILIEADTNGQVHIRGGGGTANNALRIYDENNNNFAELRVPKASELSVSTFLQLPVDAGTSGYALITDGAGVLRWDTLGSVGLTEDYLLLSGGTLTGDLKLNDKITLGATSGNILATGSVSAQDANISRNVGVGVDLTVQNNAQINNNLTVNGVAKAVQRLEAGGNGIDGILKLLCSAGTHGVELQSPPHSQGATYKLILPATAGTAGDVLTTNGTQLEWSSSAGANVYTQTTPPSTDVNPGDLWFDTSNGILYVYLNDGNSLQWVDTRPGGSSGGGTGGGVDKIIDQKDFAYAPSSNTATLLGPCTAFNPTGLNKYVGFGASPGSGQATIRFEKSTNLEFYNLVNQLSEGDPVVLNWYNSTTPSIITTTFYALQEKLQSDIIYGELIVNSSMGTFGVGDYPFSITSPQLSNGTEPLKDGDILTYDSSTQKWTAGGLDIDSLPSLPAGGGDTDGNNSGGNGGTTTDYSQVIITGQSPSSFNETYSRQTTGFVLDTGTVASGNALFHADSNYYYYVATTGFDPEDRIIIWSVEDNGWLTVYNFNDPDYTEGNITDDLALGSSGIYEDPLTANTITADGRFVPEASSDIVYATS